ncbi:MAG: tRNA epoxyqueuosine(34) reductase QueG [Chitinophagaceae bacterium]
MDFHKRSHWIKELARSSGFDYCGIAKAEQLDKEAARLEKWLAQGMHGQMHYMENYFDLRIDPRKLVPGAKSVITFFKNYYPSQVQNPSENKVSKYAYGADYHEVIRGQLNLFLNKINEKFGEVQGRGFVDSAPVLERAWAEKAGIGWQGKNGMVINKQGGSFFFIATLVVDLEMAYDDPVAKDFCGSCTRCIDVCPTEAILPNKIVDGSKCISYFTIELKAQLIPENYQGKFDNWMFGCDTCQDVCPWNRFAKPHQEPQFAPIPEILHFNSKDWQEMTEEQFKTIFRNSPLKRSKYEGIRRNLRFLQGE